MNRSSKDERPGWLVVASLLALVAPSVGCSSLEATDNLDSQGELGDGGSGPTTEDETGDADETGGADDGGDGDGAEESGDELPDPRAPSQACDPGAMQVVSYDLRDANAEVAPSLIREAVLAGDGAVPKIPLSPRPFLNHFDFAYPPADGWDPQISGELWKPPMVNADAPTRYRLQYAIRGPAMSADERPPLDLVIVVDLGPSMVGEPVMLAEEALAAIEAALMPSDRVTLITATDEPAILVQGFVDTLGTAILTGLLEQVDPAGNAEIGAALELAYANLEDGAEAQGRVVLISNGHFDVAQPLATVEQAADEGNYLICVGVGDPLAYDDHALRALSHQGRGSSLFANDADSLWLALDEDFADTMIATTTELEVTLVLPPGMSLSAREASGPAPLDEPERAILGPNDELIFHHELESCSELDPSSVVRVEISWLDPMFGEAKQASWEHPLVELGGGSALGLKGAATVAYTRALISYRDAVDPAAGYGAVIDAISMINEALGVLPEDADLIEMAQILGKLDG